MQCRTHHTGREAFLEPERKLASVYNYDFITALHFHMHNLYIYKEPGLCI